MKERVLLPLLFSLICAFVLFPEDRLGASVESPRVWTNLSGKTLTATLISQDDEEVRLRLVTGQEVVVLISNLSAADQKYLSERSSSERSFVPNPLPAETEAPREIEVVAQEFAYATPNFLFETSEPVSRAFVSEAARVYEGTFAALHAIPHGLTFSPPEENPLFRGTFLNEREFDRIAEARMGSIPGQKIVGLYLGDEQRLVVPYSSLGAERLGSRLTLRKRSDTTTLIHEIVHQVMHQYLPVLPTWFCEGMAEYLSAVPYQNGRFEFRNAERGLRERLEKEYRVGRREITAVRRPSSFLDGDQLSSQSSSDELSNQSLVGRQTPATSSTAEWTGTVHDYRDALLLVYFWMHLDEPTAPGVPVGRFLYETDFAMRDTSEILAEFTLYEKNRLAYNEEVQRFNESLEVYAKEATAYNERVERYNEQVLQGVPKASRLEVGNPPEEPARPLELQLPERLKSLTASGQRVDLVELVKSEALSTLMQGRSPGSIDEEMRDRFAEIGLKISYQP